MLVDSITMALIEPDMCPAAHIGLAGPAATHHLMNLPTFRKRNSPRSMVNLCDRFITRMTVTSKTQKAYRLSTAI